MIKTRINNEYKDIIKIFGGGTLQKEIIKVWSGEAQEYVYESSVEYTGTLPITINANGDALLDYQIYGASGGVGEPTENLFDIRKVNNPPKCVYSESTFTLKDQGLNYDIMCKTNGANAPALPEKMIAVSPGTYTLIFGNGTTGPGLARISVRFFDGETTTNLVNQARFIPPSSYAFVVENNGYLSFMFSDGDITVSDFMLVEGSTVPTSYIPYGYKLPMEISDGNTEQSVPVYIGENQLDEGEYVSYGEQKVYKRTENLFNLNRQPSTTWTYDQRYYLAGAIATDEVVYPNSIQASISGNGITIYNRTGQGAGFIVQVKPNTTYTLSYDMNISIGSSLTSCMLNTIDANKTLGTAWGIYGNANSSTFTTLSETQYIIILLRVVNNTATYSNIMLVENSTAPASYIPYGLAPTDSPVPLPEIPTIKGETVIDYDGEPKPSQMYIKYRR